MKTATDQEYFQGGDKPRIGSSALKCYMDNPMLFGGRYVNKTMPFPDPSPAFALGHAVEAIVYGWDDKVICSDMATAASKAHKEAVAANPDKIVMTTKDYDLAWRMGIAVQQSPQYSSMMASGLPQIVERVDMGEFELQCKHDWLITEPTDSQVMLFGAGHTVIDFKTTASMRGGYSNFERSVGTYNYIHQAALYQMIHHQQTGQLCNWFWFVVEKDYPFEVQLFRADPDWLKIARDRVLGAVNEIADRFKNNNWRNSDSICETLYQPAYQKS